MKLFKILKIKKKIKFENNLKIFISVVLEYLFWRIKMLLKNIGDLIFYVLKKKLFIWIFIKNVLIIDFIDYDNLFFGRLVRNFVF